MTNHDVDTGWLDRALTATHDPWQTGGPPPPGIEVLASQSWHLITEPAYCTYARDTGCCPDVYPSHTYSRRAQ